MSTARSRNSLWLSLVKRYGEAKAEVIYAQMRGRAQGPFAAGNQLHGEHVDFAREAGVPPLRPQRRC